MAARRPFEALDLLEIKRLMELAIEAGLRTADFSPLLVRAYGALAAEFGFELWSREQAGLQLRHACGRSAAHETSAEVYARTLDTREIFH
jgi:hypothetical protein